MESMGLEPTNLLVANQALSQLSYDPVIYIITTVTTTLQWTVPELNQLLLGYQPSVHPNELPVRKPFMGSTGFEPVTSAM